VSLLFNGVFLGIMARLEVDPLELAASSFPTASEIPAILIAGALGCPWASPPGGRGEGVPRGRISRTRSSERSGC